MKLIEIFFYLVSSKYLKIILNTITQIPDKIVQHRMARAVDRYSKACVIDTYAGIPRSYKIKYLASSKKIGLRPLFYILFSYDFKALGNMQGPGGGAILLVPRPSSRQSRQHPRTTFFRGRLRRDVPVRKHSVHTHRVG